MNKKTWIKPNFELELFVPNHYIAGCTVLPGDKVKITHTIDKEVDLSSDYLFRDGLNGVWDGGHFDGDNWIGNGDDVLEYTIPADHDHGHNDQCMVIETIQNPAYFSISKNNINGTPKSFARIKIAQTHSQVYYLLNPLTSCSHS